MSWHIEGDYFESCNCEAICPCRTVGGVPGGRSTYGICMGVLSWLVREGHADGVDLGGLAAAFVIRYDDDEPGSPWSFVVHVDERGSEEQREALAAILTGKLGGDDVLRLPWVRKPSEELAVRASPIELRFGPDEPTSCASARRSSWRRRASSRPRSASAASSRATTSPAPSTTPNGSPSHDEPFEWELEGNCAFVCTFSYSG